MASERSGRVRGIVETVVRSVLPVVLALIAGGIILAALGKNPFVFYGAIVENGIGGTNWEDSLVMMAPLLLIAVGLIVVFRGQLWNLGSAGQYLLAAVVVTGIGPWALKTLPAALAYLLLAVAGAATAAVWTLVPAWLKARFGTNEIITTLVMSTIGAGLTNILIENVFQDPELNTPQTSEIPIADMLPFIPGTQVHVGFVVAIVVAIVFQVILSRTSFGLRLDVFGASPKAARHVGISSKRMIVLLFVISGGLIGLGAAMDMMGEWGYLRSNWNPHYGDAMIPFVFLARLSPVGSIPFVAFYAVFATGGTIASQQTGLSVDFLSVIVALILIFMTITEYVGTKRRLGQSYLPDELKNTVRIPFARLASRSAA
ncbi:putative B6 ABC transporter permease subunit 2 [Schumannella soli]|uniref:ABC transporter permease n=1 Tax=Schumannella soli TaxID=2590779 RepID=A0A506Y5Y9_9MICO|nr:ABC transporter permease [Schumannella soli]TPW77422.1 ABC transporter permease [Schumannella soli]